MDNFKRFAVCIISLIVVASCICINARAVSQEALIPQITSTSQSAKYANAHMADVPNIAAKACVLMDADTGRVLFEKNSDQRLQMASTTKIMTTLLTIESGNLDEYFKVDADAVRVEGSSMGLKTDSIVSKRMLLYGMMLPSGNDAANAAAVSVAGNMADFVELMNKKADQLGLENTHFVTPSGLDDYTNDHYSTAKDMANLTRAALKNDVFKEVCQTRSIKLTSESGEDYWLSNTNRLLSSCEGVIGVKTGFTDKAGRCLVSACCRDGMTLICVTLCDPNDWYDHTNLYDYGFGLFQSYTVPGITVKVPCVGGADEFAQARSEDCVISIMPGEENELEKTVVMPRFIYLPMDDGTPIGRVIYKLHGEIVVNNELLLENIKD